MSNSLVSAAAVILYLTTTVLIGMRMARGVESARWTKACPLSVGWGALILHGIVLYHIVITPAGIDVGFFNSLSLVAWIIVLLLLTAALGKPLENLGIVILPIAAITVVLSLVFPYSHIIKEDSSVALEAHILISIFAYSVLSIAAVQALLLAVQDRQLRNRRPGGFVRALPPLQDTEALMFQMIWLGFILLSAALATGFLFLQDLFTEHLVQKTVLSIASWAVFGILLWGRHRFGWRGRIAIRWTLSGIGVLMLAYFGSKLMLELVLRR